MAQLLKVTAGPAYKIHVEYDDGVSGDVELRELVGKGVFAALEDATLFEAVTVGEQGQIRWTDDLEICADAVYLQVTGKSAEEVFPKLKAPADA